MYSVVSEWEEACSGVQSQTSEKADQPSALGRTASLGLASLTKRRSQVQSPACPPPPAATFCLPSRDMTS